MCAAPTTTTAISPNSSTTSKDSTKPVPKWLKMKQQNRSSAEKNVKPIAKTSGGSASDQRYSQKSSSAQPNDQSRNAKRARWAKKAKPVAKPVVKRGPVLEYISACCSAPATKPPCGQKEMMKDPESGKMKDKSKGLGHFRCTQCRKVAKVTPRKPEPTKGVLSVAIPSGTITVVSEVPVATA